MKPASYTPSVPERLDATFMALADPTRRAILARLAESELSVTELAAPFAMSQPAISKHLKVLELAGLVSRRRNAQRRPCRIEAGPLAEVTGWLEGYRRLWAANFERLDGILDVESGCSRIEAHQTTEEITMKLGASEHQLKVTTPTDREIVMTRLRRTARTRL